MPTAVLRRYTPPTCTLEIAATGSALSRWTDRTVLKNVRFNLSFDDPKLPPEKQVTLSGDRSQLETLCQAVGAYVQHLLDAAPDQIAWEPALQSVRRDQPVGETALAEAPAAEMPPPAASGVALQPKGLLSHDLHLGDLATAESGATVHLSTLQLFDLANALEEYQAEALSLPALERSWLKLPQGSLKIAASTILALGITGILGKFVVDLSRPTVQTATAPTQPSEREVNSELSRELFPTLSPPPNNPSPSITIQPLPPPPPDGAAQSNSAGLPPVGVTEPPSNPQPPVEAPAPATAPAPNAEAPSVTIIPNPDGAASTAAPPVLEPSDPAEPPRLAGVDPAASALRASQSSELESAETNIAAGSTAFDTIPQVAEIRGYFQERWQPPAELTQTLEYRLLLSADGSLQRIVPLGQASANFIDRTNMPLMGEPFVSATSDGSTPQIRLVLKPDGRVQSFLEYAN